jgi:hypothetical protein
MEKSISQASAGGSILWGVLATQIGISNTFLLASIGLLVGLVTIIRYKLLPGKDVDMTPSLHWPIPIVVSDVSPDDGPVLIQVEYLIDPAATNEFEYEMQELRNLRLRDGAISWGLYSDIANSNHYVETFVTESWAEHLRQHERITNADREIEDRFRSFHMSKTGPVVTHFIGSSIPKDPCKKKVK